MVFPDTNNVKAITFIDASTGFCTGQYFDAALGDYIGIIYKTTDAGLNWDTLLNTGLGNNYANDITFLMKTLDIRVTETTIFFVLQMVELHGIPFHLMAIMHYGLP
jgi:photosystem II stability/assembly factor-like uncharacterized protein